MGRKRIHRKDLPPRVRFKHGAYYLVSDRWHRLGRDYVVAMERYAQMMDPAVGMTMGAMMDRFLRETRVGPRTKQNYLREMRPLRAVFGEMFPQDIRPSDIYAYMAERPRVAANREKSLLSGVLKVAIRLGLRDDNPCRFVQGNPERPRDRFVEDFEYRVIWQRATFPVRCAMDLAYATGLRLGDVLKLTLHDVKADGLHVLTGKTKARLIYELTPELEALIAAAKTWPPVKDGQVRSLSLICNRSGQPYTLSGFESVWQKLMNQAVQDQVIPSRFTFHDLRAKAASEAANATELLGHQDPKTTRRVYRRLPTRVTPNGRFETKDSDMRQGPRKIDSK
ncbi:MAG: tyrosine-type recombinase/integrase [Patescibacteria group bacterium]|nr:tyrosine-type recombinase/integrase [Patescibacteria group bacterium]